jgi:hypothetical protein
LFPKKLSDLCQDFGVVENKKGIFPHNFATEKNLFYIGPTPPFSQYDPKYIKHENYLLSLKKD